MDLNQKIQILLKNFEQFNTANPFVQNSSLTPELQVRPQIKYKFDKDKFDDITVEKTNKIQEYIRNFQEIINRTNTKDPPIQVLIDKGTFFSSLMVDFGLSDNQSLYDLYTYLVSKIRVEPYMYYPYGPSRPPENVVNENKRVIEQGESEIEIKYTINKYRLAYKDIGKSIHTNAYLQYVLGLLICLNISFEFIFYINMIQRSLGIDYSQKINKEELKRIFTRIFKVRELFETDNRDKFQLILEKNNISNEIKNVKVIETSLSTSYNLSPSPQNPREIVKDIRLIFKNFRYEGEQREVEDRTHIYQAQHELSTIIEFKFVDLPENTNIYEKCVEREEGDQDVDHGQFDLSKQLESDKPNPNTFQIDFDIKDIKIKFSLIINYYYCKRLVGTVTGLRTQYIIKINDQEYYLNQFDEELFKNLLTFSNIFFDF